MEIMRTFTIGDTTYEIVDDNARGNVKILQRDVEKIRKSVSADVGQVLTFYSYDNSTGMPLLRGVYRGYVACARGIGNTEEESVTLVSKEMMKIELNTWIAKNNNLFKFTDGGIQCPVNGIVRINGSVAIDFENDALANTGVYIFKKEKNKDEEEITACYGHGNISSNVQIVTNVNAGDIIYLKARSSSSDRKVYPGNGATNLCIEYI